MDTATQERSTVKRRARLLFAIAISLVCLYFFAKGTEWDEVWEAVRRAHFRWIVPSLLAIWGSFAFRALRWKVLLRDINTIGLMRLYNMWMIGLMVNGLFPVRFGEVVRAIFLGRKENVSFLAVFASVIVERVLDLAFILLMLMSMLLIIPLPAHLTVPWPASSEPIPVTTAFAQLGTYAGVFLAAVVAFVVVMGVAPYWGYRTVEFLAGLVSPKLAQSLVSRLRSLMEGISVLHKPLQAALAFFWTLPVWICVTLSTYLLFRAFEIRVDLMGAALLTATLALSVGLPQAPGFVGVFHWAAAMVLQTCFGVDAASAKACAIVLWFVHLVCPTLGGFPSLAIEGISFSEIRKLGDKGKAPEDP